ncbi:tRNA-dihydrouridine synthase [bacterium]|nr:tRNA-dihydrouridine synthase [bacterium]
MSKPVIGLAPMEGYSDSAFRAVCKKVNSSIVTYTEFTSADGLVYGGESLRNKLKFDVVETPVIAQIFGKKLETFIGAAKLCEEMGFTGIDINMGCPAKKVVKSEHGVALRKNHDHAFKLIEALANATTLPVSVKTRLGWSDASDLVAFGIGAQNSGADMICIHARTYKEPYNVPADFNPVYEMKRHLSIPVLGNGGITSIPDGLRKLGNLDGFLIGQAAIGNPWVFGECPQLFSDKIPLIIEHAQRMVAHKGERIGIREMRKHLLAYAKGFPGARQFRSILCHVATLAEVKDALTNIVGQTNELQIAA